MDRRGEGRILLRDSRGQLFERTPGGPDTEVGGIMFGAWDFRRHERRGLRIGFGEEK